MSGSGGWEGGAWSVDADLRKDVSEVRLGMEDGVFCD